MTTSFFPLAVSEMGFEPIGSRKAFSISSEVNRLFSPPFMGQKETLQEEGKDNSISLFPYQICCGTLMLIISTLPDSDAVRVTKPTSLP
jgi:hypothetical protein